MASGWLCGQTARDFTITKTGRKGSMDIQKAEEFKTTKFFCKTNFDMEEIKKEEASYANYPLPKFYNFGTSDAKERTLYKNFNRIDKEVNEMITRIQKEFPKQIKKQVKIKVCFMCSQISIDIQLHSCQSVAYIYNKV